MGIYIVKLYRRVSNNVSISENFKILGHLIHELFNCVLRELFIVTFVPCHTQGSVELDEYIFGGVGRDGHREGRTKKEGGGGVV